MSNTIDLSSINPDEYYEAQEIADKLQISYKTIWKRTKYGGLKSVRLNRKRYIKGQDLLDWIESQTQGAAPTESPRSTRPPARKPRPSSSSAVQPMDILKSIYK